MIYPHAYIHVPLSYHTDVCLTYRRTPHFDFSMMPSPSTLFYCLAWAITFSTTEGLRPLRAPSQIATKMDEIFQNGSAVPGASPVKYHNNPDNDLFIIESLDMHPNPCVMFVLPSRFPTKSSTQPSNSSLSSTFKRTRQSPENEKTAIATKE